MSTNRGTSETTASGGKGRLHSLCPHRDGGRRSCPFCLLKPALEIFYCAYNRRRFVHPDPLEFLYDYPELRDREVAGLVASALAFGRVRQILNSVRRVLTPMGKRPRAFLLSSTFTSLRRLYGEFRHRYAGGEELARTLFGVRQAIARYGSLEECFAACRGADDPTVAEASVRFMEELMVDVTGDGRLLIPEPTRGSACKRMHLFLRWMVRSDDVDPGGWRCVGPEKLIVPLDTHMHRVGQALGFTTRKAADLRTAVEITHCFRRLRPDDPVRYDFALTRLGIRDGLDVRSTLPGL